jgi:hypothetical protein
MLAEACVLANQWLELVPRTYCVAGTAVFQSPQLLFRASIPANTFVGKIYALKGKRDMFVEIITNTQVPLFMRRNVDRVSETTLVDI